MFRIHSRLHSSASHLENHPNFIHGRRWTQDLASIAIFDPATAKAIASVSRGSVLTVEAAVTSASQAFRSGVWAEMHCQQRFTVMTRIAALLRGRIAAFAVLESTQTGRPIREMQTQLARLPEWLDYQAAICRTIQGSIPGVSGSMINNVNLVPLGVVAQITSWNHPLLISIKKIAPALAAGNSVVVKPSELAPINVLRFAELCSEAGLPDGVLNVVCGYGHEAGVALATNKLIRKIDITGGAVSGRAVAKLAGENLIETIAELGGKSCVIVFKDSLHTGVIGACFAAFIATGQTCVMGSRILVHEDIYNEFVELLQVKVSLLIIGDPQNQKTQLGPVITGESRTSIHKNVTLAVSEGATLVCGGYPIEREGFFYAPTILADVTTKMSIFHKEVFGPVVTITKFSSEAEALQLANDSEFGLAASVWTQNLSCAHRMAKSLDVGIVWVNTHHSNDPASPWGGVKSSGMGKENGIEAYRAYSTAKSTIINYGPIGDWFGNESHARYG